MSNEADGCDNQRVAIESGWANAEGALKGDIDGDGQQDLAHLVLDGTGDRGCQAFLVVRTATTEGSEPVWEAGPEGGLPAPRLHSLAEINGEPGLEVLVDEIAGASTQFVGAFAFVEKTLERITPADINEDLWDGAGQGVFPYGGSVGHLEAADCAPDADVVVSVALPAGAGANTYMVVRRFFDVEGAELIEAGSERTVASANEVFDDIPEFRSSPFGSCPT